MLTFLRLLKSWQLTIVKMIWRRLTATVGRTYHACVLQISVLQAVSRMLNKLLSSSTGNNSSRAVVSFLNKDVSQLLRCDESTSIFPPGQKKKRKPFGSQQQRHRTLRQRQCKACWVYPPFIRLFFWSSCLSLFSSDLLFVGVGVCLLLFALFCFVLLSFLGFGSV